MLNKSDDSSNFKQQIPGKKFKKLLSGFHMENIRQSVGQKPWDCVCIVLAQMQNISALTVATHGH